MDSQQYSLSWNHFHTNLTNAFHSLLYDQDLVDVTIAVDGRYLKAHKLILSICSPYFKELFNANPCKHPIVVLQDVQYKIFKSMLLFMYQGEVKVSQHDLAAFMKVAEVLKIKGLTEYAEGSSSYQPTKDTTSSNELTNGYVPILPEYPRPIKKPSRPLPMPIPIGGGFNDVPNIKKAKIATHTANEPVSKEEAPMEIKKPPKQSEPENEPPSNTETLQLHVKEEPMDSDAAQDDNCNDSMDLLVMSHMVTTALDENPIKEEPNSDSATPGTLQCIIGRRGLPRLVVDGFTFYRKSTYKNKCFWYCKSHRLTKCTAVCWTINGCIVKWPAAHTHELIPEVFNPLEDQIVPTEMLKQVLIDAAR